jgi:hypothetical protein
MKYCSKCGCVNDGAYEACLRCGTPLSQAPGAPAALAVEDIGAQDVEVSNTSSLWLMLNIAATLLCCPGFLFSVAGIVFAALGSERFAQGDLPGMRKRSNTSMVLFLIAVICGLAGWVLLAIVLSNRP